jgi:hypothetical protein
MRWAARWQARKLNSLAANVPDPAPERRRVDYRPGDYSERNAILIGIADSWRANEILWNQEAADSMNPDRANEALAIARQWAALSEAGKRFYSRWEIEN